MALQFSKLVSVSPQFLAFTVVGGIGFIVDATVLTVLVGVYEVGLYTARGVSFSLAVTATWYLNRNWTFSVQKSARRDTEYARYLLIQIIGALLILGIYIICIEINELMAAYPVLPLAIGAAVALFFNFFAAKIYAYRSDRERASC